MQGEQRKVGSDPGPSGRAMGEEVFVIVYRYKEIFIKRIHYLPSALNPLCALSLYF